MRLAARLTGWDIDILTPPEFEKNLLTIQETLNGLPGFEDGMLDKMGALGLISVFDIEEVGVPVLTQEIGMSEELAESVVIACHEKGKIVAEEQRIAAEQDAATDHLLGGGMAGGMGAPVETDASAESAADSILGGGGS